MTQSGPLGSSPEISEVGPAVSILFRAIYTAWCSVLDITSSLKCPVFPAKCCFLYIDSNFVYITKEDGYQSIDKLVNKPVKMHKEK